MEWNVAGARKRVDQAQEMDKLGSGGAHQILAPFPLICLHQSVQIASAIKMGQVQVDPPCLQDIPWGKGTNVLLS